MLSARLALGRRRTRRNKRRKLLRPRADGAPASDERRERNRCPRERPSRSFSVVRAFLRRCDDRSILSPRPQAARERIDFRRIECRVRHRPEWICLSRPLPAFASLKELAQGVEPGGFNEWRLSPKCATIKEWSKKNAEGLRHRERASPTLSTGGTRRVGRQLRCGPCPMKPATYWTWSAASWNVSARPWSASGMVCPQSFSANFSSTLRRVHHATPLN